MECTEQGDGQATLRGTGQYPCVLELTAADAASLRGVCLVAESKRAVDEAAERFAAASVDLVATPGPCSGPLAGYGLSVWDPAGILIELRADVEQVPPRSDDRGPMRIAHVGINCTDVGSEVAFYVDHLGCQITDEYEGRQTVFLAFGLDHHRLVINAAARNGVQHVAYEMADLDAVMSGLGRMRAAGHDTIWGPGRHGPGGNAFCYYEDPTGIVVEHSTAPFQLPQGASWHPQVWRQTPDNANVWGLGGPSPRARELMS
jgi:catechol 2,3-dioxygenase-like lactoylglutathione lyase family enzyme